MMTLLHLASIQKIENGEDIEDKILNNSMYFVLCNGIEPKARTIRDYKVIYSKIRQLILSFALILAKKLKITKFKHLTTDGRVKLDCNSPFNILKKKDIHLLIKHYMVEELSKKEIKKLRRSAKKFLYNKNISKEDKVEMLYKWYDKLELTGQKSIPLYDVDTRLMKVKDKGQKYKKWAYYIQVSIDTDSKLVCGVNVVQYPTDHYQIPALIDQTIKNIQMEPEINSIDLIYGTLGNLFYLKEHNISARIPTSKQSREIMGRTVENPYHLDHFKHDKEKDVIICPENQELFRQSECDGKVQKGGFYKREIQYYNKEVCKNCPNKSECTKSEYKIVTLRVHELSLEVGKIMDTPKGRKDYKKRMSTAEPINGIFRNIYICESYQIRGLEITQDLMFRIASGYNTIRIYNIACNNG